MMPLGIILPVQQALTVTLPSYDSNMSDQSGFHPFSVSEHPTIAGIADEAEILTSLQRPKKVRPILFCFVATTFVSNYRSFWLF
jgi:serine/threonine-protein kinase ATR